MAIFTCKYNQIKIEFQTLLPSEMENTKAELEKLLTDFSVSMSQIDEKYSKEVKSEEDKKIKKKLKKHIVDAEDEPEVADEKVKKMLDELYKNYEITSKSEGKVVKLQKELVQCEVERNKSFDQRKMIQNLHSNFRERYQAELKRAQDIEKEEENKRKAVIEELQERIKKIQDQYEEAGKIKIEKYKENETLKHEISKLEPHLIASQSLYDAQLKKKTIEIEIQMTTLKQKIEMMNNFKTMSAETEEKLKNSKEASEKIEFRVKLLGGKEDEHKILMAKAHLIFEDYKKALNTLKDLLPKKQKEALVAHMNIKKKQDALVEQEAMFNGLDKEFETQVNQLQTLKSLEQTLIKQLDE